MNFLNPSILWALPVGLVPLIIHLFNRRKIKEIHFSTTHFLKQMVHVVAFFTGRGSKATFS